jgi:hypothetical protein
MNWTVLKKNTNVQQKYEEKLSILSHKGSANQNNTDSITPGSE